MSYKISVIIPTFNSEKFIETTIKSVMEQSIGFENIELILIDDFSQDNTPKIINEYCENYENIVTYKLDEKAGAPGNARNIGIEQSNGEYLMFMDHDDYYPKNSLETLYNKINGKDKSIVIGRFKAFGIADWESDMWVEEELKINDISENTSFLTINNIWRMIFPKKLLIENNIRFPEKIFAEDLAFMIESYFNADEIIFMPNIVYCFRIRESDNSSTSYSKSSHYISKLLDGYYYTRNIMKKYSKCEFYDLLFSMHLGSWIDNIINSELNDNEVYNLINDSQDLFKDLNYIDFNINPNFEVYRVICENLRDGNFSKGYDELLSLKNGVSVENNDNKGFKSKLKGLFKG